LTYKVNIVGIGEVQGNQHFEDCLSRNSGDSANNPLASPRRNKSQLKSLQ